MSNYTLYPHKFAETSWSEEDMENVLDLAEIPITAENLDTFFDAIDEDDLIEAMIEAGWGYLYYIRDELERKGKFKNPRCPRCGNRLEYSDIPEYTWLCTECDENFYSFEAR